VEGAAADPVMEDAADLISRKSTISSLLSVSLTMIPSSLRCWLVAHHCGRLDVSSEVFLKLFATSALPLEKQPRLSAKPSTGEGQEEGRPVPLLKQPIRRCRILDGSRRHC
jgi:hypothetical protein